MIYVVNKSTRVTNADARTMTKAVGRQLREHVAPAWQRKAVSVRFISDEGRVPAGSWVIAILDDADQANALGWHTEGPDGSVYGRVFAAPVLDHGGAVLLGSLSVAAVLSHEVIETFCDPNVSGWCDSGRGFVVALEACDPVENDSYALDAVSVSNFVTPSWFDSQAPAKACFDHLGNLAKPFTISTGGYWVQMADGRTTQKFGRRYPAWKKATKQHPAGRGARRATAVSLPQLSAPQVARLQGALVHASKVFTSAFLGVVLGAPLVQMNAPTLKAAELAGIGAVLGLLQQWANLPGPVRLARGVRRR